MIESALADINTNAVGEIISYNAATNRAVVRPSLPKKIYNGDTLEPPKIVEVPVNFHSSNGGESSFTMPLQPGDPVTLSFQQRSLEGWLKGNKAAPDDPRQFDLSDCIAHPGGGSAGVSGSATDVVLKFKKCIVTLKEDGTIMMGNDKGGITIDAGGNMVIKAQSVQIDTPARIFNLERHVHKEVQKGGELSGEPNP